MKSILTGISTLILSLLLGALPATGLAQTTEASEASAEGLVLELSSDIQAPGTEAFIVLSVNVPDGLEVGGVTSRVSYPSSLLTFLEATPGLGAEAVGAEIKTAIKSDETDPANSIVEVTVLTNPARRPLVDGILTELIFQISEDAPLGQNIPLGNEAQAMTREDPPRPIPDVIGKGAEIEITGNPPVFACFFYMH